MTEARIPKELAEHLHQQNRSLRARKGGSIEDATTEKEQGDFFEYLQACRHDKQGMRTQ
jgi:hypothetical protein